MLGHYSTVYAQSPIFFSLILAVLHRGVEGSKLTMASPIAADSLYSSGSDHDPDTYSINGSLLEYPFHFQRRYHKFKEGSYPFPNDDQEQTRQIDQYNIIRASQGGRLFFAPLKDPHMILDVGTGTGIWCIELADSDLCPNAHIVGIDLSPIQPQDVPPNVIFEMQDCAESDWGRALDSFDFIYSRCMLGSLTDFAQYLITARKYLKPGEGWVECCELMSQPFSDDNSITPDWTFAKWEEWMDFATTKVGRPLRMGHRIKQWMIDAGFVDVKEVVTKVPIGSWPADKQLKLIGKAWADLVCDTLAAASYKTFNEVLQWDRDAIEVFLADTRSSLQGRKTKVHAYHKVYTVYGRRPSPEEEKELGWMAPPPPPPPPPPPTQLP